MAEESCHLLCRTWILILLLSLTHLHPAVGHQTKSIPSSNSSDTILALRSCCSYRDNTVESSGSCINSFSISWNVLKLYHIPRPDNNTDTSGLQKFTSVAPRLTLESGPQCANRLNYTIPMWKPQLQESPRKGFFAFFSEDGHFQYDEQIYSPGSYCIDRFLPQEISVLACNQTSSCVQHDSTDTRNSRPCLFRCCNYGEVWDFSGKKSRCTTSGNHKWIPKIFPAISSSDPSNPRDIAAAPIIFSKHPRIWVQQEQCKPTFQIPDQLRRTKESLKDHGKRPFRILEDGSIWMKLRKFEWVQLNPGEYCVDGMQYGEGMYSGHNDDSVLLECKVLETQQDIEGKQRQRMYSLIFGIILSICLCFLLMTTIVYILLWHKHNIHGWTVFCYIVALLLTYLMLAISHLASITLVRKNDGIYTLCGIIGIFCHFAFLSTFSWSVVLNYDLWCTFKSLKPISGKSSGLKKFLAYSVFAFAIPASVVSVGVVLDIIYWKLDDDDEYNDIITPEYGRSTCYVEPRYARLLFVTIPVAVMLTINLIFFCHTAHAVYKLKKSTKFASSSSTKTEARHQTFRLILKLMLVNGIIWIVDILSWNIEKSYDEVGLFSFILNVVTVLQALAIFFLFVFKNDILGALKSKYPSLEGIVDLAFKIKNFGRKPTRNHRRSRDSRAASAETCNSKLHESIPVTRV